jgi:hypothetical protein
MWNAIASAVLSSSSTMRIFIRLAFIAAEDKSPARSLRRRPVTIL